MDKCKWLKKELCGCKDCPMWMKYCPVSDVPGVCKFEENTPVAEKFAKRQISAGLGEKFPTEEIFTLMPLRHPTDDTSPLGEALGETKEDKRWMYLKR